MTAKALAFPQTGFIIAVMPNPLLTIEHLRVDFPEVVAVNDLSLTVEAGDVCGLIGPNGAGKTTTMRAVSGLQECTRGSVKVDGHELAQRTGGIETPAGLHAGFLPRLRPTHRDGISGPLCPRL